MAERYNRKLYVGGLDPRCAREDLRDLFAKFGRVEDVWVARSPPGFAFVTMEDRRDAEDAMHECHNTEFMGNRIRCEIAKPDRNPPRFRGEDDRGWHGGRSGDPYDDRRGGGGGGYYDDRRGGRDSSYRGDNNDRGHYGRSGRGGYDNRDRGGYEGDRRQRSISPRRDRGDRNRSRSRERKPSRSPSPVNNRRRSPSPRSRSISPKRD